MTMNHKRHLILIAFLFIFLGVNISKITAQRSIGGSPISFSERHQSSFSKSPKTEKISKLNLKELKKEDRENPSNRYAAPINVNFDLNNSGQWYDLKDGSRVWKLKIKGEGALGLFILYKNFYLPNGARLFVYNENRTQILGAYTSQNNSKQEKFLTGMIKGETAIIEYYEPNYARNQGRFEIYQIMQAYEAEKIISDYPFQNYTGFGQSFDCHENINCSAGDDYQVEKRGTVRILTVYNTGIGWCTGSLINTTENDGKPYVLSAYHCGFLGANVADFPMWRYDFNYEFPTCADETEEPTFQSILGSQVVAGGDTSDFLLLELSSNIPSSYNAYFNGWNRANVSWDSAAYVHHPFGDVRKISIDSDQVNSYNLPNFWSDGITTPPHSHYRSVLDVGTIEGGSSGAPFFNPDGQLIGQLHGGVANCNQFITYAGKMSISWDNGVVPATRLKDWLDPNNTGVMSVAGIENPALNNSANVSGNITREDGTSITDIQLQLTGASTQNINNQANGDYELLDLELGETYTITPFRNDNPKAGVNIIDLVLIKSHILELGEPLDTYGIIAGDVDQNGSLNTFDMVLIQKLILDFDTEFSNSNSWRFVPADYVFQDPLDPLDEPFPESITYDPILASFENQNFIAIKVGDVNHSANVD